VPYATGRKKLAKHGADVADPTYPSGKPSSRGLPYSGGNPARDLAHDRNDLLNDITAGAAGSTSQQILDGSSDLCFGLVRVHKIPIALV